MLYAIHIEKWVSIYTESSHYKIGPNPEVYNSGVLLQIAKADGNEPHTTAFIEPQALSAIAKALEEAAKDMEGK